MRVPVARLRRIATLGLVVAAFGTLPGAVSHPVVFEQATQPLPPSPDHDADLVVVVRSEPDHQALVHARVRVLSMIGDRAYLAGSGETDGAGRVALRSLPRTAAWILADATGFARASSQRVLGDSPGPLEMALSPAHPLAIAVVDDLGQPVPDAAAEVTGVDPLPVGMRTDAAGHATTERLGVGPWTLVVRALGFEDVVHAGVREGETARVVLRKLGALVVTVLDERGAAAPLVRVQVAGTALWPARTTDTRPDGTVRIGALVAGSYALRATSGSLVSPTDLGIPLARGEERHVTLRLSQGVFATAKVVEDTDDGASIAGARMTLVEAGLSPFPIEGTSDIAGTVRLGPVARGPAFLSAQAAGFVARGAIEVPSDGHPLTVVMVHAGVIEGRVEDAHGRAVDGATIEIVGSSAAGAPIDDDPRKRAFQRAQFDATLSGAHALVPSGELGVVPGPVPPIPRAMDPGFLASSPGAAAPDEPWVTKEDGTFRAAPASPGRVRVIVRHPEFLEAMSEVVTLTPGGQTHVDVVLREGGALEGRVVDGAGRAVAGASVTLAALRGSIERRTRSASDGTFAFAAIPDGVVVTASLGEDTDARVARATVHVADAGRGSVSLTLPDARPAFDVHVRDDRGYPISAAQVSVGSVDPGVPLRTTAFTDAHGDVSIGGARGVALRLEVSAPGHAARAALVSESDVSAEITLESAELIHGTVRESRSGTPIHGAEVALYTDGGVRRTETDADGHFRLHDLARGSVRLRVQAAGHVSVTRELTVAETSTHSQDIGYVELGDEAVVLGTVLDAHGNAVGGARVGKDHVPTYLPVNGTDTSFAVTDVRGRFRLGGLEDGVVTLEAYAPDVGRARVESLRISAAHSLTGVTLRLVPETGDRAHEPASSGGVAITLGELSGEPREVVVVGVAEASEAERAGVVAGDVILTIDGATVSSIVEARERLSGPIGDDVVLSRRRGENNDVVRVPREAVRR